jgi:hypothetical protein
MMLVPTIRAGTMRAFLRDRKSPVAARELFDMLANKLAQLYDGGSISGQEALHLGTPVIATDAAPRSPDVTLVATRDLVRLGRAIEQFARSPARSRPRPVRDESNLRSVLELYEGVCARRSGS